MKRNNEHYQTNTVRVHCKTYLKTIFAMVILPLLMASLVGIYVSVQDTNAQELVSSNQTNSEPKDDQGPEDNQIEEVQHQEEAQSRSAYNESFTAPNDDCSSVEDSKGDSCIPFRPPPDKDCLFNPSLAKCTPINGQCPEDFHFNDDGQCVPDGGCPEGYHWNQDDESGTCHPNSAGCPERMIFTPDRKGCEYKEDACKEYPQLNCEGYQEPVVVNIKTDKKTYPIGQTVKITVTNDGTKTATFADAALGFKVENLQTGKIFTFGAAQVITYLTPGESRTFNWNQQGMDGKQSKPGTYSASVDSGPEPVKTTFKIEGGNNGVVGGKGPNAGTFIVQVQVTNNGPNDEKGGVYVRIDDTDISKSLYGVIFPSKKTITKTFEFNSKDVPVGKGFSAEIVYGDDYDEQASGVNSPSKAPETVKLFIGPYQATDDSKFMLNVKVENKRPIDDRGSISVSIDGTNIYQNSDNIIFPSKKTITKTFEFNSKDVPIGKGFKIDVYPDKSSQVSATGINSPSKAPEIVNVNIG